MQGFEEVVNELIFNSAQIKKVTLDLLVKLMLQNNKMKPALCQSVLRLCED